MSRAAVYAAEHALLGRPAAIKVLLPELSKQQDIVMRFFNEARAATAIRHPGIVDVYDFGWTPDGAAYIVMEHLEGETLSRRVGVGATLYWYGYSQGKQREAVTLVPSVSAQSIAFVVSGPLA